MPAKLDNRDGSELFEYGLWMAVSHWEIFKIDFTIIFFLHLGLRILSVVLKIDGFRGPL